MYNQQSLTLPVDRKTIFPIPWVQFTVQAAMSEVNVMAAFRRKYETTHLMATNQRFYWACSVKLGQPAGIMEDRNAYFMLMGKALDYHIEHTDEPVSVFVELSPADNWLRYTVIGR